MTMFTECPIMKTYKNTGVGGDERVRRRFVYLQRYRAHLRWWGAAPEDLGRTPEGRWWIRECSGPTVWLQRRQRARASERSRSPASPCQLRTAGAARASGHRPCPSRPARPAPRPSGRDRAGSKTAPAWIRPLAGPATRGLAPRVPAPRFYQWRLGPIFGSDARRSANSEARCPPCDDVTSSRHRPAPARPTSHLPPPSTTVEASTFSIPRPTDSLAARWRYMLRHEREVSFIFLVMQNANTIFYLILMIPILYEHLLSLLVHCL